MQQNHSKTTTIHLTSDDAELFKKFMQHYDLIAYFVGYLEVMGTDRITNSQIVLDIDSDGIITHTAITKHFRR
jgi:hypothetical protein